jgi:hypothetical protein
MNKAYLFPAAAVAGILLLTYIAPRIYPDGPCTEARVASERKRDLLLEQSRDRNWQDVVGEARRMTREIWDEEDRCLTHHHWVRGLVIMPFASLLGFVGAWPLIQKRRKRLSTQL